MALLQWLNADLFSSLRDKTNTAITTIGKVLVSNGDTTHDYLYNKITAGTAISIVKNNPGANETITISAPGKADSSQFLLESTSAVGPISYGAETTIITLVPSVTQNSAKMKYTFTGYLTNDVAVGTTIKLKRAGTEIARTITVCPAGGQINFCIVWIGTYTANQSITITAQASDGGEINHYCLICESNDAI